MKGRDAAVTAHRISHLVAPAAEPADTADPVLSVRGVRRTFQAELAPVRALRGIDLDVAPAEFLAIMGPSGCGKSTLLNLVAGLDLADDGEIIIAGETITGRRGRARHDAAPHIGIVFQFFNLLDGMTVLENVVVPAMIAGTRRKPAETRARDLLDLLGLGDKSSEYPAVLSGGQRQRLAIARRSPTNRPCCSPTSPPGRSTATVAWRSSSCSVGCTTTARRS